MLICYNITEYLALLDWRLWDEKKHTGTDIEKIIANASATLAVEGMKPSKTALSATRSFLKGEISSREAVAKIRAKYIKVKT